MFWNLKNFVNDSNGYREGICGGLKLRAFELNLSPYLKTFIYIIFTNENCAITLCFCL